MKEPAFVITECLWKGWEVGPGQAVGIEELFSVHGADTEIGWEDARNSWLWHDCLLDPTLCPRLQSSNLYEKLLGKMGSILDI